jgi:tetratricopeptide (TPR) repeat protein
MRARNGAVLLFPFLLWLLPFYPGQVAAEVKDSNLERILNPLPDYNPFDSGPPPPQFFPDQVDSRVHRALIDSLINGGKALKDHAAYFTEKDTELTGSRGMVTGLTGHVLDLLHETIEDRQEFLAAQKENLASASSEKQKRFTESIIRNDELTQADRLLRKSKANRLGGLFNRLLGSVDLIDVLSGSYVGAAVDSTVSELLAVGSTVMSIEERKALTLYREYLKRYPDDPLRDEVLRRIEALDGKKKTVLVERQLKKARAALGHGENTRAEIAYEVAAFIDPESPKVKEGMDQLRERMERQQETRQDGLSVSDDPRNKEADEEENLDLLDLLQALTLRNPEKIEAQAAVMAEKYQGTPLGESAGEALAVALEIKGQHEEAKKLLQKIADSAASLHEKKRAEALLESSEYNLLAAFHDARSQRRLQTVKFFLLGEDFLEKNLLLGTGPLVTQGLAGASSWGAANLLMVGTNLFELLTSNPVSQRPIIDKGMAYIRSHPESADAEGVYAVLAEAYEEAGRYDKAIAYYRMGVAPENKIAELQEKAAGALLQAAEDSDQTSKKELYLMGILKYYPESAAAKDATRRLAELPKIENRGLRISKKFFMENPELHNTEGLSLKPTLFDGDISNMELANKGVNLLGNDACLFHFQTPWGIQSRVYPVEKRTVERFGLALRKKHYEIAMMDVHTRPEGSPGGIANLPSRLLREGHGREGKPSEDGADLAMVRRATNPAPLYPKVLDHQLLSESENDRGGTFSLPPVQGSISGGGFNISGKLPTTLWGDRVTIGTDKKSSFAGFQLPIPLIEDFIPVDFLFSVRPGRPSISPRIHRFGKDEIGDADLYR